MPTKFCFSHNGCRNPPDMFWYVCRYYISKKQVLHKIVKGTISWIAYKKYFRMYMGDQDKPWVIRTNHVMCGFWRTTLAGWLRGRKKAMPFGVARVWGEQKNHHDEFYFCMIDITKYRKAKGRQALSHMM